MPSASSSKIVKWEDMGLTKFLHGKDRGFDGCDTVRLYDYLIYYEQSAIKYNVDEEKRIRWFVHLMIYGAYVYDRLRDDQKRTWTEFKQNLLEEYKKEEQVRMSWSVPRYAQQKRMFEREQSKPEHFTQTVGDTNPPDVSDSPPKLTVEPTEPNDSSQTACCSKPPDDSIPKLDSDDRILNNDSSWPSKNRRRCYNCGSSTHILANCRVPPASVRRSNYRGKNLNVDRQNKERFVKPSVPNDQMPLRPQLCNSAHNVRSNDFRQGNLLLSSGAVVPFCKPNTASSDSTFSINFGSLLVDALRLQMERQAVPRLSRQLPSNWRWPRR